MAATPGTQEQLRRASSWRSSNKNSLPAIIDEEALKKGYYYDVAAANWHSITTILQFAALVSPPTRRALTSSYH